MVVPGLRIGHAGRAVRPHPNLKITAFLPIQGVMSLLSKITGSGSETSKRQSAVAVNALADDALDTLSSVIRVMGDESFRLDIDADPEFFPELCSEFACHVENGGAVPSHKIEKSIDGTREWAHIRRFFADRRQAEKAFVNKRLGDYRGIVEDFVTGLRDIGDRDKNTESAVQSSLEQIQIAVETGELDQIKGALAETVEKDSRMAVDTASIVRKLTAFSRPRQVFDVTRSITLAALTAIGLSFAVVANAAATNWQSTAEITATAENYLRARIGDRASRTTVKAGRLDSRHLLAACNEPLEAFLHRGTKIAARTVVGVRCEGVKPWKVYIPVDVIVTDTVLVARRTLPRGHVLSRDDLLAEQRDVSRLVSGYIADPQQLLGQRLKTQLLAGRILTPQMLQADIAIRRGQSVTLAVNNNGLNIRMSGKALMDGALGQRIRVENTNSGRVVEGIVRSPEHVEILMPVQRGSFHTQPKVLPKLADTGTTNNDR